MPEVPTKGIHPRTQPMAASSLERLKGFLGAIKREGKTRRAITTYRCNSCGYLASQWR
jgi:hypothetical protein